MWQQYHLTGNNPFEPESWMHTHHNYDDPCSNSYVKSGFGFADNNQWLDIVASNTRI